MRILLTGTQGHRKGFIANHFMDMYRGEYEITAYKSDIRDAENIQLGDFDMVLHLAALAGVRKSHEEPEEYWHTNVIASQYFFDSCKKQNVPIIYASSSSVYEWWQSPYATTKWAMEHIAKEVNSIGLRFHTVYGPESRTDMLYDQLCKRDPSLTYLTNHTRDWTHVSDVCSAIHICIKNFWEMEKYKAIDVGNGKPVSVVDMANAVWPDNNLPIKEVSGEREHTCADPTILKKFGWAPQFHILNDRLPERANWYGYADGDEE